VTHQSDPHFLVLHGLRLKGFAAEMVVARFSGLAPVDVDDHLAKLAADGHVRHRDGRITGWSLTPSGRARHAEHAAADMATAGCRDVVAAAYQQFLEVNQPFLAVCTDWQLRAGPGGDQAVNDHLDPAYDAAVIGRLRDIDAAVQPVCARLSQVMHRFSGYGPRLAEALAKVQAGELDWFTGALIESYHTLWFELHEDLLATLGIERARQGSS
jgi:hypothetical protein